MATPVPFKEGALAFALFLLREAKVGFSMQVNETNSEGMSRSFTVTISAADIETKVSGRLAELSKTINLPGFRPGKAPMSLLKKKYGASVMGEVLEKTVQESSSEIIAERELRPAMQPKIEITKFDEGGDLEYSMDVELMPEITLGDFSKLKLERLVTEADESEVDKTLERMSEAYKVSTAITGKRKSKSGDVVLIDFLGKVDGEAFPGGAAEKYELELGSNSFIPGFEDQVIGMKADEEKDVTVNFPGDYGAADLAGKEAVFEVKLHEIRESTSAPIDDELAKKVGVDDLETLKGSIREEHARGFNDVSRQKLKRTLLDVLAAEYTFELPAGLITSEYDAIMEQYAQAKESGQAEEDDLSDDEREADYKEIAARRVRLGLLLAEVGRANNIQVTQDDINKGIMDEAKRYPGQEQMVFEHFQKNPEALQQLHGPIFEEKIVDFIVELAKPTEKMVSVEELLKPDEEPKKKKKAAAKKAPAKKAADKKPAAKKAPAKKAEKKD